MGSLIDRFGRRFPYLRLSVIEACNYHCSYCLPKGYQAVPGRPKNLDIDEIARLLSAFATLGMGVNALAHGCVAVRKSLPRIFRPPTKGAPCIGQVLANLLSNANTFTPHGSVNVSIFALERACYSWKTIPSTSWNPCRSLR